MPASVCMTEKSCPWVAVSIACVADTRRRLMRLVFVCLPSGSLFRDVCSPVFLCLFHSPPDSEAPDWAIKCAGFPCHGIYAAQFHVFFTSLKCSRGCLVLLGRKPFINSPGPSRMQPSSIWLMWPRQWRCHSQRRANMLSMFVDFRTSELGTLFSLWIHRMHCRHLRWKFSLMPHVVGRGFTAIKNDCRLYPSIAMFWGVIFTPCHDLHLL